MADNSTDPEFIKRQFEELQKRLRITGVGGVTLADGSKSYDTSPEDSSKVFEERKKSMTYKNGVASFGAKNKSIPNARPRRDNTSPSGMKVFALGDAKPKGSKEYKK